MDFVNTEMMLVPGLLECLISKEFASGTGFEGVGHRECNWFMCKLESPELELQA